MPIRKALIIEAGGERFRFHYDLEVPEVLHITLRHGTTPEDAIRTFFDGEEDSWDEAPAAVWERDRNAWPLLDAPRPRRLGSRDQLL